MKNIFRTLALVTFALLFVGTIVFIYQKSRKKEVVYSLEKSFVTDITRKIVATGKVVPEKEVAITPKVSGLLSKIFVEAGDYIKAGQPIAQISIVPNMVSLNEAESRKKRAVIALSDAKKELERNKPLFKADILTEEEFDRYETALKNADVELTAAKDNLSLIKKGITTGAKGETNTIIRSTIDGMILELPLKEGNSVIESNTFNNGTTVAIVADVSKMIFEGVIDESDVNKLKLGMPMELTIGAIEGEQFNANITFVAPKGKEDQGSIQFDIKAAVELKEGVFIRAGYSANANIIIEQVKQAMAINEGLLQFDDQGRFVEVAKNGKQDFEKVYVKTGLSDGINVEIISGINNTSQIKKWDNPEVFK